MKSRIQRIAVLGSGVIRPGIAARLANPGVPCLFLEIGPRQMTLEEVRPGQTMRRPCFLKRLALFWLFLCAAGLFAQEEAIKFHRLSLEDGLSQSSVNCILQDSRGFMWFGTQDGLNLYDGYTFTVYKHDPADPGSLSNNFIRAMWEDRSGALWIGTNDGLSRFDLVRQTFTVYRNDPDNPGSLSDDSIRSILEDKAGVLWVGTQGGGLSRFDRASESFTNYRNNPAEPRSLGHNGVLALLEDSHGVMWVGTNGGGLNRLDRERKEFTRYVHDPANPGSLSHDVVLSLYEDRAGTLWVGTRDGGLDCLVLGGPVAGFSHFKNDPLNGSSLSHNRVQSLWEDSAGTFWVGTFGGGLDRFEGGRFTAYKNHLADPTSLSNNDVQCIYEDRSGTLWIGTHDAGVCKFSRESEKFLHIKSDPSDPDGLSDNAVYSILEDRAGVLWIGTFSGGLNRWDREKGSFLHYKKDPLDPKSLSNNTVALLFEDSLGVLWVGCYGGGISSFDRKTGKFLHYKHDLSNPRSLSNDFVWCIVEDHSHALWIGTDGGLNRFDRDTGSFTRFVHDPSDGASLPNNPIASLYEDRAGTLWIGSNNGGLHSFHRDTGRFTHFTNNPSDPHSLSNNTVWTIHEDASGALWLGTRGGLNRMPPDRKGWFDHFTEKDGLPNDVIYGILEDEDGNLWLSTNRGLSKFHPGTRAFRNYDADDGLQSNEFNSGAYFRNPKGEMFFGGINGFNCFYPRQIKDNPLIPPIVITSFKKFDKTAPLDRAVWETEAITLSYKENFISFEFAALDYAFPRKNRYAYKMEGFDKDWIRSGTRRYASYTNLDPGRYVFRVKGSNADGVWSEEGVSLKIFITPPFWATWWFRTLAGALLLMLVAVAYKLRVRTLEAQRRLLEAQVRERTGELKLKTDQLEQINVIVQSINTRVDFIGLLESILRETRVIKGMEEASALVYDREMNLFRFKASFGWDIRDLESVTLTPEEAEERYVTNSQEIYEDIYIAKQVQGRAAEAKVRHMGIPKSMLITRIRVDHRVEGYFIFDNMHQEDAFDDQDIQLLRNLKEHIRSAFIKAEMLEDLRSKHGQITEQVDALKLLNEELRIADEMIKEADRMKSEFLARMSHELRTPLNAIIGFSDILLERIPGEINADQQSCLTDILESGRHLLGLINDILDLSKIEAGRMELDMEPFDLHLILPAIGHTMAPLIEKKGQTFRDEAEPDLPMVRGDSGKIWQVILNLLSNANKFTPRGGSITLQATEAREPGFVEIAVKDTGLGIPADRMKDLFDEFRQFGSPVTRGEQGTGLGLAICKRFVEMHGGRIWAESQPGEGSAFHFTLPQAGAEAEAPAPPASQATAEAAREMVLIVEDDEKASRMMRYYLEDAGYAVEICREGALAATLAKCLKPSVITLDIFLPDKDGWEILRDLKSDPEVGRIPVIIVSIMDNKELGFSLDADDYFVKPADKNALLKRIGRLCAQKDAGEVLIVDDDPAAVRWLSSLLEGSGYTVLKAYGGREGIAMAQERKPALIILDLVMPEVDGFEVVETLRSEERTRDIPILLVTAKDLTKAETAALDDHIKRIMAKGAFQKSELLREIRKYVRKKV